MVNKQSNTSKQDSKQSTVRGGKSPRQTLLKKFIQISPFMLVNSVPDVVRSINNAFKRQDQISYLESGRGLGTLPSSPM